MERPVSPILEMRSVDEDISNGINNLDSELGSFKDAINKQGDSAIIETVPRLISAGREIEEMRTKAAELFLKIK